MPTDPGLRAFVIHLIAYAVANVAMIIVNLATAPADPWFQWPLLGWGIGLAAHGLALWAQRTHRLSGLFASAAARGLAVHGFVYVAVNLLLIVVNLTASEGGVWFPWVLVGWGLGLAAHAFIVWRSLPGAGGGPPGAAGTESDDPWPESSLTESPKTGVVAPAAPEAAPTDAKPASRPRKTGARKRAPRKAAPKTPRADE